MKNFNRPFTVSEATGRGMSRQTLSNLVRAGKLERITPGIYMPSEIEPSEKFAYQVAALKCPSAVICLLSALRVHNFTVQNPSELHLAVEAHHWAPTGLPFPVRIFTMSKELLSYGVVEENFDGVRLCVTSPAKTVADLFKFRNKIGLDVALEALREGFKKKLFTIDELMQAASICRVARIIRPYAESLFL